MVKKYFLIIFLNIFLKFDFRFARRPLVLAVGDLFRYSLNIYKELVSTEKFDNSKIREKKRSRMG